MDEPHKDDTARQAVKAAVTLIINETLAEQSIKKIVKKHDAKVHFVPHRYRVLGGLLISFNIKFGSFIERLLAIIVDQEVQKPDAKLKVVQGLGKEFSYTIPEATSTLIDHYINRREEKTARLDTLEADFQNLLAEIVRLEQIQDQPRFSKTNDLDAIFQTEGDQYVYLEIKYNHDHDSDKFRGLNQKILTTYAGLVNHFGLTSSEQLRPILYYFNVSSKPNRYIPSTNVYFGEKLFTDYFSSITYQDVQNHLREVGDDPDILQIFDEKLYKEIRYGSLGKQLPEADPVLNSDVTPAAEDAGA